MKEIISEEPGLPQRDKTSHIKNLIQIQIGSTLPHIHVSVQSVYREDYQLTNRRMWCWRRLLWVPWTERGSNQSILKETSPGCSLEGLMLRLKFQYFGHLMHKSWLIGKDPDAGRDWGQEEKGMTEDEMAGWHHRLDAHEFGWTPGAGDRQGGLACCDSWGRKELDTTEQLNWTEPDKCRLWCKTQIVTWHFPQALGKKKN